MHIFDPCCFSSDLPGVNPATYNRMVLYYCLNDQSGSVLGDSTVLSWAGCLRSEAELQYVEVIEDTERT
jgi:hypothetical protein